MPTFDEALAMAMHDDRQSRKGLAYPPRWADRSEEARDGYRAWARLAIRMLAQMNPELVAQELRSVRAEVAKDEQWPG